MNRSERRFRTEKTLKKRVRKNLHWLGRHGESWAYLYDEIKKGIHFQWIKHTGRICSCSICKKPRYTKKDRKWDGRLPNTWSGGTLPLVKNVK